MSVLESQLSFAAGEVSKQLWARRDLAKRQVAARRAENVCVMLEGGLTRRPGTRMVAPLKDMARLAGFLPFRFSRTDAYMLVFNGGVIRFYRNGGIVETSPGTAYEVAHPYTDDQLKDLRWQSVLDKIFISCRGQPARFLHRLGNTNWRLDFYWPPRPPLEPMNVDGAVVTLSGTIGSVTLTSSQPLFDAGHVSTIWRLEESIFAGAALWKANEAALPVGTLRRWQGRTYRTVTYAGDAGPTPPTHTEGWQTSGGGNVTWAFVHPGHCYVLIDSVLNAQTCSVTIQSGEAPASLVTPGSSRWFEPAWSTTRGWPEHVAYLDQRLIFARSDMFWMTRPGDLYDFEIDQTAESGLIARLSPPDGQLARIEWLLASGIIVVGCSGSEWLIRGPSPFDALKIDNMRPIPTRNEGSAPHRPLAVDGGVIWIANTRRDLHFGEFDSLSDRLDIQMATKFSRHMLTGKAKALAYQRSPHRIVWAACEDGSLRSLTFRPSEDLVGWTRHTLTNGFVEDIAVMPGQEQANDELWLIVRRWIGGQWRRYIEVMQPFFEAANPDDADATGAWFLDSALPFAGGPFTELSGLDHLEGQSVGVFADGAIHPDTVVSGGRITLQSPATAGLVGLPIDWRIHALPIEIDTPYGSSKADGKRVRGAILDVVESAGGRMSVNGGEWEPIDPAGGGMLGLPVALHDGQVRVNPAAPTADVLDIRIEGHEALPFTLSGISLDIEARR